MLPAYSGPYYFTQANVNIAVTQLESSVQDLITLHC